MSYLVRAEEVGSCELVSHVQDALFCGGSDILFDMTGGQSLLTLVGIM